MSLVRRKQKEEREIADRRERSEDGERGGLGRGIGIEGDAGEKRQRAVHGGSEVEDDTAGGRLGSRLP